LTKRQVREELGVAHSHETCPGTPCSNQCDHIEYPQVKQLGNNTFEIAYPNGDRAIRYYHTDIITYRSNGDIVLNSGGWLTTTTRDRFRNYLNVPGRFKFTVLQENKIWYLVKTVPGFQYENEWVFRDGITIHPNGTVTGGGPDPKTLLKLDKSIQTYVTGYIKALFDGKIDKPNQGDCWYCYLHTTNDKPLGEAIKDNDHIQSHIQEKYYVPSLLMNAINVFPVSIAARASIGYYMKYTDQKSEWFDGIARNQIRSSLRRYLRRQLGLAT
jgi:hypothetical protein